jgi:hypothetical protein
MVDMRDVKCDLILMSQILSPWQLTALWQGQALDAMARVTGPSVRESIAQLSAKWFQ